MEVLDETVSSDDLKKFERAYYDQLQVGSISKETQFEYAWCLVRSQFPADIRKGIILLEDLFCRFTSERRDYLYYLSIGNARLKEYTKALQYCREFLKIEPMNQQVQSLETVIKKKMDREGKIGMALTGAGIILVGSLVGLGISLAKSK